MRAMAFAAVGQPRRMEERPMSVPGPGDLHLSVLADLRTGCLQGAAVLLPDDGY